MNDTEKCVKMLADMSASCVLVKDDEVKVSFSHGIMPLMEWLREDGTEAFAGCSAADKVVGGAAAYLFVYGGAAYVYGEAMSQNALDVFDKYKIKYAYGQLVPYIKARDGVNLCPMVKISLEISSPDEAFARYDSATAKPADKTGGQTETRRAHD